MNVFLIIVLAALLLIKMYCVKDLSGKPECYGGSHCGDTDCETCCLYYECEKAASERLSDER